MEKTNNSIERLQIDFSREIEDAVARHGENLRVPLTDAIRFLASHRDEWESHGITIDRRYVDQYVTQAAYSATPINERKGPRPD